MRTTSDTPVAAPGLAATLASTLTDWARSVGVGGASLTVVQPGVVRWAGAVGLEADGSPLTVDQRFGIQSITKTFTGALVMREAAKGTIQLDQPLPRLATVPEFPYAGRITVRQLLNHSSGLVDYRKTNGYAAVAGQVLTPEAAVRLMGAEPLAFAPGEKHLYTSGNFLVLGLLLEQVTGRSYESLLADLFSEYRLDATTHDLPGAGTPNLSASGITTDLADLARWGRALLRDRTAFPTSVWSDFDDVDMTSLVGPVWGYCPCTVDAAGQQAVTSIGQSGAAAILSYAAADDTVVVAYVPTGLWDTDERHAQVVDLVQRMRAVIDAGPEQPNAG